MEEAAMAQNLYTVKLAGGGATLDEAARKLGLEPSALDPEFGLVLTSPAEGLYTVLLREGASPTVDGKETAGPYANPAIGAFGPPRS
jgi:hypothetical protein